jgi:16S rRNA (uracil1498-N3)-methyltransferase
MKFAIIERKNIKNDKALITGSEARHVGRVLRLKVGDTINLLDEMGWEYRGVITDKKTQAIEVRVLEKYPPRKESPIKIVLGQALPKAQKMDYIVQKATELGVDSIIPFFSSRTVPILDRNRQEKKGKRWEKIVLEATKQCGRTVIPQVEKIHTFEEVIRIGDDNSLKIILWEDEKNYRLHKVLKNLQQFKKIIILVGPEGGFTQEEVASARDHGFFSVGLGNSILRTETAGVYLLSVLHYKLSESF